MYLCMKLKFKKGKVLKMVIWKIDVINLSGAAARTGKKRY